MKIAILKGGTNITFSSSNKSAANADILYALRVIDPSQHECTIVTNRTRNTFLPKPLKFLDLKMATVSDFAKFDAVLVFNFSINFFGGKEDPSLLNMYRILAKTDVPIYYANTDGQLMFKQLWPSIWKRDWAKDYNETDFYIKPDKVRYITQGRNEAKMEALIVGKPDHIRVPTSQVRHFRWDATILAKHEKYFSKPPKPFSERPFELAFGGATRNTHKRKMIERYYQGDEMRTLLFGNLRGVSTKSAKVEPKCSYQQFIKNMERAEGTVIVGDVAYNDNFFTLRMYESLLAGCLVFIDNQLDPRRLFYKQTKEECNILYVSNAQSVASLFRMMSLLDRQEFANSIREDVLNGYDLHREHTRLMQLLQS